MNQIKQQPIIEGPDFAPYDGLRTTVAVLPFVNLVDVGGEKIGSAIADMLISMLVRSGRFVVLEREKLEQIIHEQALGQSGVITEEAAIAAGNLLGVQSVIIGEILELEEETSSQGFGDDENKKRWSFAFKTTIGHVRYSFKIIDTATGEIKFSDTISATEFRPGIGVKTEEFDFEDSFEFDQTIVGLANRKAINNIAKLIVREASNMTWHGKVVKIKDDDTIYFTPGSATGVMIGDYFKVLRNKQDEMNGIDLLEEVAIIQVVNLIGDKVALARLIEGSVVSVGDRVRPAD
ncbi:hypothetical protein JXB12_04170 [candidate division KSB1 bacterium]|nr:hypothetical protein [candidate division KSB1 bacterium]